MCISRCAGGLEPAIHFVSHTLKQNVRKSTHAHTRERGWEGQGEGDRAKFEQERVRGRQSARGRGSVRGREYEGKLTKDLSDDIETICCHQVAIPISLLLQNIEGVKSAIQTTDTVSIDERQDTVPLNCLPHPPLN